MKILVAVDGSNYSRMALEFIATRQTLIEASPAIQVLHVIGPLPPHPSRIVGRTVVREYYAEEAERILKPARKRLEKAGLMPTVGYVIGSPAKEISAIADQKRTDLVVLGSHGRTAFAGLLFGSVTTAVLARTKRAVLIIRGEREAPADSLRVGIAVDGSPYGPAAVKYVLRHAELFGVRSSISVIHVVPAYDLKGMPSRGGYVVPEFTPTEARARQDDAFKSAVAPVRKLLKGQVGIKAKFVRLVGNPGDELSAYAENKLDVLVMGSHGYGALLGLVMGSVTTRVAARCSVPLLIVRRASP